MEHVKTDLAGFKAVAGLYAAYRTLADVHADTEAQIGNLELQATSLETSLASCEATLEASDYDRRFVYRLRESEQQRAAQAARKQRVKAILFGTAGGVGALAIGIVFGAFVLGR